MSDSKQPRPAPQTKQQDGHSKRSTISDTHAPKPQPKRIITDYASI